LRLMNMLVTPKPRGNGNPRGSYATGGDADARLNPASATGNRGTRPRRMDKPPALWNIRADMPLQAALRG
jgi:hypothetical protein